MGECVKTESLLHFEVFSDGEQRPHHSYEDELRLCEALQTADPRAQEIAAALFSVEMSGQLSGDPMTNLKYLFVAFVTLVTRFCIEGGLSPRLAYRISDQYIRALDNCTAQEDVFALRPLVIREFLDRMALLQGMKNVSVHVKRASEYILKNLGEELTLERVSGAVQISPSHLSHLFGKELGISFNRYVRLRRVEAVKDLLRYTDCPAGDIAAQTGFSSQSHMIGVFREMVGVTPACYRRELPRIYGRGGKAENCKK